MKSFLESVLLAKKIEKVLQKNPGQFRVVKFVDSAGLGLHWYNIFYSDPKHSEPIRGNGFDFKDPIAICKAWSELVERLSLRNYSRKNRSIRTSNGFAAHRTFEEASFRATSELIERDALLSSWLLGLKAIRIEDFSKLRISSGSRKLLKSFDRNGFSLEVGILGQTGKYLTGIAVGKFSQSVALASATRESLASLIDQLILESSQWLNMWNSPEMPTPISSLPQVPEPFDHHRLYLMNTPHHPFHSLFLDSSAPPRTFPDFEVTVENLTAENPLALETGISVARASSSKAQELWFGETEQNKVNLPRLAEIAGKPINFEELNLEPHPLP